MKPNKPLFFAVLVMLFSAAEVFSQTDKEQLLATRNASNAALRSYNTEEVLSYLTDDVLTTTGNGTLLCGKEELKKYILSGGKSKMYWVRHTQEIEVYDKRSLAWESGVWYGYDPDKSDEAIINGHYSAMWTKESGTWKIKSQLFVTLDEN